MSNSKLVPVKTSLPAAPDQLINVIRCKCKSNCDNRRCSCRKHGIQCTTACTDCRGRSCSNPNKLKLKRTKMIWNNFNRAHGYLFEISYINSYVITFISSECVLRNNVGSSTTILST